MLQVGQEEIDAVAKVIRSKKLFRYTSGSQCAKFERRYSKFLGVKHVQLTSSGTTALTAALTGLGIGPGDEVIVPGHTFMATAVSVLAVGAIPVIVDVDESMTIAVDAIDDAAGPRTRAVIPVHMWGLPCDMEAVMRVARKHKLLVVEDACQAAGGGYRGRMLGSIGAAAAFSFNFFKNMTCGEGGAVVSRDERVARRASCAIDCCAFYWSGRGADVRPFASNGSRASEIEGAMLNAQLDRIGQLLRRARRRKKQILRAAAKQTRLSASPCHSIDDECGTHVLFNFPTAQQAAEFAERTGGTVCGKTGRHTYNEWDPILAKRGGHHPAMNPFEFPANRKCRMNYSATMLPRTLDLVNRTVMIATHPEHPDAQGEARIRRIIAAAKVIGAGLPDGVGRVVEAARSSSRHTRAGQRDAAVRGPAHRPRRGER